MSRATRRARKTSAITKNREDALGHMNKTSGQEYTPIASHRKDYVDKLMKERQTIHELTKIK